MKDEYDVIVLGSGIAGSMTALVLQQIGVSTLVVERRSHPRFAIGESTVPTTSLLMHGLAVRYDIPELADVSHYFGLRENGCAAWPKQHFWYGVHQEGSRLDPQDESVFEGMLLPVGPDLHMLRADADAYLVSRLPKYGADYIDQAELVDFVSEGGGVSVRLKVPSGVHDVRARMVVDASGHSSFLARKFELRDSDPNLSTNTRTIFGHFAGVPALDDALGGLNPDLRFKRNAGTMHHCFPGGWIWVIPFDNDVTSVGVQLDRRQFPLDPNVSPEDDFAEVLRKFPSIEEHLRDRQAVRPLIRADRIQFTSRSILGDGFILTPHAAGFVEPLFSTGILLTAAFLSRFAEVAREAKTAGDWSPDRFRHLEAIFFDEIQHVDHIVNGTIQSFRHPELFRQYWRYWVMGTFAQWCAGALAGGGTRQTPMIHGAGFPGFADEVRDAHEIVCRRDSDPMDLAKELEARVERWWTRICGSVIGAQGSLGVHRGRTLSVRGAGSPELLKQQLEHCLTELQPFDDSLDLSNVDEWFRRAGLAHEQQLRRYEDSSRDGTDFHRAFDFIISNQNASTFDYFREVTGTTRPPPS